MQIGAVVVKESSTDSTIRETPLRVSGHAGPGAKPPALPPTMPVTGDSVGGLLQQLAAPQIANLISGILSEHLTRDAPVVRELMQSAISAVVADDGPRALDAIKELVVRRPEELEAVRTEPAFAPIRSGVEDLLQRHMTTTRTDVELKVSLASHAVETSGSRSVHDPERDAPQILSVAHQLLATDRHANVLLAGDLAQTVINYYIPVAVPIQNDDSLQRKRAPGLQPMASSPTGAFGMIYSQVINSVAIIGERVPLKFLLWVWFVIGLLSGLLSVILRAFEVELFSAALPLEIWGAGSVGFLGFSTYRIYKKKPENPNL
jgi:hypothetical protein